MGNISLNNDGQPVGRGINFGSNEVKAINTLYGLCMGILADGRVDDSEILFLDTWLKQNSDYIGSYPLNVVHQRIEGILSDGVITWDECMDLYQFLGSLVGGTVEESGAAGGNATKLPVDKVVFEGSVFCFTGSFVFGQRIDCEAAIEALGATAVKSVSKKVDYLVIGELASRDWVASSHGRKIEKALLFKEKGFSICILSEQDWVGFIRGGDRGKAYALLMSMWKLRVRRTTKLIVPSISSLASMAA